MLRRLIPPCPLRPMLDDYRPYATIRVVEELGYKTTEGSEHSESTADQRHFLYAVEIGTACIEKRA